MPRKGVIPPQFLERPPRSWRGEMPRIEREAREDRRGRKARKRRYETMTRRREGTRRRRPKDVVHIIPDAMAIGAIALPFVNTGGTGYSAAGSLANVITGASGSRSKAAEDFVYNLTGNLSNSAVPSLELLAGAYVVKWAAKKFGLNRLGNKRVKIA